MTEQRQDAIRSSALRREVERLLASKNECSPALHTKGVELVRQYERLIAAGNGLAEIVAAFIPEDHHHLCESRGGGECDCYMRGYAKEQDALSAWVGTPKEAD